MKQYNQELCISSKSRCFTKRLQSRPLNWFLFCHHLFDSNIWSVHATTSTQFFVVFSIDFEQFKGWSQWKTSWEKANGDWIQFPFFMVDVDFIFTRCSSWVMSLAVTDTRRSWGLIHNPCQGLTYREDPGCVWQIAWTLYLIIILQRM